MINLYFFIHLYSRTKNKYKKYIEEENLTSFHKFGISIEDLINKENTYIDIGSTIDKWLNNDVRNKRCYAIGVSSFSDKTCIWG